MKNMSIKTLLFAGVTTLALCTGAQAQNGQRGNATQSAGVNQSSSAVGVAFATGGNQRQTQSLSQANSGGALVQANIGLQSQIAPQINVATNIALQSNIAVPIQVKFR